MVLCDVNNEGMIKFARKKVFMFFQRLLFLVQYMRDDQSNVIELRLPIELVKVSRMPVDLIAIRLHSIIEHPSNFYIFLSN